MMYSLLDFNQEKAREYNLDIIDLVLLHYVWRIFPLDSFEHIHDKNEKSYVWLKHSKILNDLPILNIKEEALKKRIKKLVELGLLVSITDCTKMRGKRTYYALSSLCQTLIYNKGYSTNDQGYSDTLGQNQGYSDTLETPRPSVNRYTSDNKFNTTDNKFDGIKENTKEKKSKSKDDDLIEQLDSYDLIQNYPELKEHFIEFIQARREQKEPLTSLALKKAINTVKGFFNGDIDKAIRSIDKSILCGYKGLFDPDDNDKFKSKHKVESNDYFGDELKRFNAEKSLSKNEGQIEISFTTPLAISSSNQSSGMTEEEQEAFLREYGI